MKHWKSVVAVVVALFIGVGIGSAGTDVPVESTSDLETELASAEEEIEALQADLEEALDAEPVEVEKVVTRTPKSCLDFINTAREVNSISSNFATVAGDAMQHASDGFEAILSMDVARMEGIVDAQERTNRKLTLLVDEVTAKTGPFNSQAAACEKGK